KLDRPPSGHDDPKLALVLPIRLQTPTLALWGEMDNNILAEKNKAAWEAAFKAGGNRDYTLRILPRANHLQLEAKVESNAEMASLRRFVPAYFTTIRDRLAKTHPRLPSIVAQCPMSDDDQKNLRAPTLRHSEAPLLRA